MTTEIFYGYMLVAFGFGLATGLGIMALVQAFREPEKGKTGARVPSLFDDPLDLFEPAAPRRQNDFPGMWTEETHTLSVPAGAKNVVVKSDKDGITISYDEVAATDPETKSDDAA